jgi:hypothetical protein
MADADLIDLAAKINACKSQDELRKVINDAPEPIGMSRDKKLSWFIRRYERWAFKKSSRLRCFLGIHRWGVAASPADWRCSRCKKEVIHG